jgi:4-hydroxymandelate oxidase
MVDRELNDSDLRALSLNVIQELAQKNTPLEAWEHIMGAAESRATYRRNQAVLRKILFRQSIFHNVVAPDTTVELFGRRLPSPIAVAPVGSFGKIREGGEREVAEGAGAMGTLLFVSHAARSSARDWAEAAASPLVFMGYLNRGKEAVLAYARLAEELGYAAVGLTMDTVQPVKIGDHVALQADGTPRQGRPASPRDIEWLKGKVSLPVVVKGIMGTKDAHVAVEAGADCIVVSNHGGRILDFNRAAAEALPEVAEAVGKRIPVLMDSGVRRGGDVVKVLALGAKAVLVGRPICWGLGAGGAAGVQRVLRILDEEMKRALVMTGTPSVAEVTRSILITNGVGI